jgi:hypothetical protein
VPDDQQVRLHRRDHRARLSIVNHDPFAAAAHLG